MQPMASSHGCQILQNITSTHIDVYTICKATTCNATTIAEGPNVQGAA